MSVARTKFFENAAGEAFFWKLKAGRDMNADF